MLQVAGCARATYDAMLGLGFSEAEARQIAGEELNRMIARAYAAGAKLGDIGHILGVTKSTAARRRDIGRRKAKRNRPVFVELAVPSDFTTYSSLDIRRFTTLLAAARNPDHLAHQRGAKCRRRVARLTKRTVDAATEEAQRFIVWDADLKGFGLRVEPSGAKTFVVRYRVGGGRSGTRRQFKIGSYAVLTPDQARSKARQVLAQVVLGQDPQAERACARRSRMRAKPI